jgi:hypothetical protein
MYRYGKLEKSIVDPDSMGSLDPGGQKRTANIEKS